MAVRAAPTAIVLPAFLDIAVDGSDEVCAFDARPLAAFGESDERVLDSSTSRWRRCRLFTFDGASRRQTDRHEPSSGTVIGGDTIKDR